MADRAPFEGKEAVESTAEKLLRNGLVMVAMGSKILAEKLKEETTMNLYTAQFDKLFGTSAPAKKLPEFKVPVQQPI